ncbi:MAG: PIG-L family deacetylase, partial [Anaerolineae bacterium]|nr:PIG-L family deacetylase [Anaerolineae bacterium]
RIHIVYATDGMKSPSPVVPWRDSITPDLGETRMQESKNAVQMLGIPAENTHFLGLPEAELRHHIPALQTALLALIKRLKPAHILMPFRYDRHPDHLAINHIITTAHQRGVYRGRITEYFVYYRWRLLPKRDVRHYIQPQYLLEVEVGDVSRQKRTALDCFKSQTTIFYPWQTRPILTQVLLDEVSYTPELFLRYEASAPGATVFSGLVPWIRIVHRLEPLLQKWKYLAGASLRRGLGIA